MKGKEKRTILMLGHNPARAIVSALAVLLFALWPGPQAFAAAGAGEAPVPYVMGESPVSMEAGFGYDNMAKGGRYLPVYITLTNQEQELFSGSVTIKAMESDFDLYAYEYPVELEGESSRQINLNIPLGLRSDQLYAFLNDQDGRQLVKKRLKLNMRQDTPELLIGMLSDSQVPLKYLNGVGVNFSTLQTRAFSMVAGSIPRQAAGMDQLDVLLITNYDIRRLSGEQIDTIREWVKRGGVLLLGTGERGAEAVETFLEQELAEEIDDPVYTSVEMGQEFAVYNYDDATLDLPCTKVRIDGGRVVFESRGMPVLTSINKGRGMIAVAAYDFADISEFAAEHAYVDKLFTNLLGEARIRELSGYLYEGAGSTYWAVQSMLNSGTIRKLPKISVYVAAIISYIVLIGPGLYFLLKWKNARSKYRLLVVVFSFLWSGIIYLLGSQTRFKDVFFNYATIRDYADDTVVESTFMNMGAPYNRTYDIDLDPSYDIRPITGGVEYLLGSSTGFTGAENANLTMNFMADKTRLTAYNIPAFEQKYFRLEKREEADEEKQITGRLRFFDGKISGFLTNNLDTDLEQVGVLCSGALLTIDTLKAGETVALDGLEVHFYPLHNSLAAAGQISGGYRFDKTNIESKAYLLALERSNLLSYYLDEFLAGFQSDAKVVAFTKQGSSSHFLLEDKYEVQGISMVTTSIEADYEEAGRSYYTSLEYPPRVVNGNYYADGNTIDGSTPVTLEYALDPGRQIEKLIFQPVSDLFTEGNKYGNLEKFKGDIYFFNYHTGNYDKMISGQREFNEWQLEPYLSERNVITIKYSYEAFSDYYFEASLPLLTVVGSAKGGGQDAEN